MRGEIDIGDILANRNCLTPMHMIVRPGDHRLDCLILLALSAVSKFFSLLMGFDPIGNMKREQP